jgi:hypothetical protein
MNWFRHDTDCTQDAKLKKLLIRHGAVGYAIYFHCLELIAAETSETNLTFELEHDSEIIADNLHIRGTGAQSGIQIVEQIMRDIVELGLFEESQGRIFCFKLLKRLDTSMTSNPRFRQLITQAKAENHDGIMTPSCNQPRIPTKNKKSDAGPTESTPPRQRFTKPTPQEVADYCRERKNHVDPVAWFDHYESNGWKAGQNPMRDWRAAVRTWERNSFGKQREAEAGGPLAHRPDAWGDADIAKVDAERAAPRTAEEIAEVDRLMAQHANTPAGKIIKNLIGRES